MEWRHYINAPWEVLAIWHGGLVWYGGFLGGLTAGLVYARRHRLSSVRLADHLSPAIALGHGIGRIGCFFNGCCYGRPTDQWCGVLFPGHAQPVLPTQLFEAAGVFLIAFILYQLQQRQSARYPGRLFGLYLTCYGMLRFGLEFLRGDQQVWRAGLTLQQLISLLGIMVGTFLFIRRKSMMDDGKNV